ELARLGAHVVVVGRDPAKTDAVVAQLRAEAGHRQVSSLLADLSSQAQVRTLARQVKDNYPYLDVLINNAGGIWGKRQWTVDGIEMTVAVNHLAPFLLATLLLDTLQARPHARVVNVSSGAHRFASIHFGDLMMRRRYWAYPQYCRTKLMVLLFTYELARR